MLASFARLEPNVFFSRFTVLGLCLAGLLFALTRLSDAWALPALTIFSCLCLLGVIDLIQTRHAVRRNYPIIGRLRWAFEKIRPEIRQYLIEGDDDQTPFSRAQRSLVYARAKDEVSDRPFGTLSDVYKNGYEFISHSTKPKPLSDPDSFRVPIGGSDARDPYMASIFNISAMSFGSLSANAIRALNKGAKLGDFAHDTGEGGISPYHRENGGDLIWEIGSGYFGCRTEKGRFDPVRFADNAADPQVKMIELKLSQGAKPGHGGILPGEKVSPEIAATRGIPVGVDCISPAEHSAFSTPLEMMHFLAQLRTLSKGKPVGFKLCVGHPWEFMGMVKAMRETGIFPDFIVVDGAEGGTGAAPVEFSNRVGMPLREGLILVRNALVGSGLKPEIKLAAAGKVHSGAGMAMNFGLGADFCNAGRAFMFALGCVQSLKCHTDACPTGVATQDSTRQRGLVPMEKAERVTRFQRHTLHSFREMVIAMGLDNPWQIAPHLMSERINGVQSDSFEHLYRFLEPGELLDSPESTPYAKAWAAARADTFREVA